MCFHTCLRHVRECTIESRQEQEMDTGERMNICPVILAGGTGTRLWPISRELMPKQFLQIIGDSTLFQQTALRSAALCDTAPLIVCHDNHYFYCQDQLETINIDKAQYLLEPMARNTAG